MPGPLAEAVLGLSAAGLAAGGVLTHAALSASSQLFGKTLIAPPRPNELALTFDDGPNGDTTLRLLDILDRHNAPATFFLIGRFVQQQPQVVRAIAAAGHTIGNHTQTHPWLHLCTHTRIREELTACNKALEDTLGTPIQFFRAPHGARRPYVLRFAAELGLIPVQWNLIPGDWTPITPESLLTRIHRGIARNQSKGHATNLVLHDGSDQALGANRTPTLEAVDRLLAHFPARNLQAVSIVTWLPSSSERTETVAVDSGDPEMLAAINAARASLPQFIESFLVPKPTQKNFLLKATFEHADQIEHIWLADLDLTTSPYTGVVANEPALPSLRFMQRVPFQAAQITDWMYYEDERLVGGYTTTLLKARSG